MRPLKVTAQELRTFLQARGLVSPSDLMERFQIGRATVPRLIAGGGPDIVRIGTTNRTRYGLLRSLPGVGAELPLSKVLEDGRIDTAGALHVFHASTYAILPDAEGYSGLPPEIADMRPQGFMGRAFAHRYAAELGVSARLDDWSNDQILIAIARRGEDLPGNLILGQESAERWRDLAAKESSRKDYPELVKAALGGQPAGSSAGGEQAKFAVLRDGKHILVKFGGTDDSAVQVRWRDLLICEFLALRHLAENGIPAAEAELYLDGSAVYLEVERFDRVGARGRRGVITLAAITDYFIGERTNWSATAVRLQREGRISAEDARTLRFLDAFGAFIADSDRHYHNVSFFTEAKRKYRLAPAFDKLPMYFAPVAGAVPERQWAMPIPNAHQMDVWEQARTIALGYWQRVMRDERVSVAFRKIAAHCEAAIHKA